METFRLSKILRRFKKFRSCLYYGFFCCSGTFNILTLAFQLETIKCDRVEDFAPPFVRLLGGDQKVQEVGIFRLRC